MRVIKTALKGGPDTKKIRISLNNQSRSKCFEMLDQARNSGTLPIIKRLLAVLAVFEGTPYSLIATTLKISKEFIRLWVNALLLKGVAGLKSKKAPGRPCNC
jgi:hypothetical protein